MGEFRYSEWDGSQNLFDMDADELMDKVGRDLMTNENIADILRRMQRNGLQNKQGKRLPGLQELLQRLRQKKQDKLNKYDLGSMVDEIREKLNEIKKKEREGIQDQLEKARQKSGQPGKDQQGQDGKQPGQKGEQGEQQGGQEGAQQGAGDMTPEMRERLNQLRQQSGKGQRGQQSQQQSGQSGQQGQQGQQGGLGEEQLKKLLEGLEERARQNLDKLDGLPKDLGGQIKELNEYDFMDGEARQEFQELMEMLKKHAMESYGRDMMQNLQNMDPGQMAAMRNMLEALNQMLEQRMNGQEPDFDQFMQQFGDFFGPNPPQNLDQLMERMQEQMTQARNLLNSLSPKDRKALQDMMDQMLDEGTKMELEKLARNLETLFPSDEMSRQYDFEGEESISYTEALKLMEEMQKMDKLEEQMKDAQRDSMDNIDPELFKELMGDEASEEFDKLREIMKKLEEAGYIRYNNGRYELTPAGMRKIGQKALQDIFSQLQKDRVAGHSVKARGKGGDKEEETKRYEWGDDLDLDFQKTLMNALRRGATKPPLKLSVDDFEVNQWHAATRTAIVLMLDLSLSMFMRNYFEAAKRTAIALDTLIRSQFPKDNLYIVGFSQYARVIKREELFFVGQNRYEHGTNLQHGLMLAEKLLAREGSTQNKQIILITDGEPTAHIENGDIYFQYPPTLRTMQMTLREVRNVTKKGIVINTFMLDDSVFLSSFMDRMTSLNKGRIFYADASNLGKYVLHDYISKKKKLIS